MRLLTLMLAPLPIAGSLVVNTGEEVEFVNGDLMGCDAQLMVQLALGSAFHAHNSSIQGRAGLARHTEGMRAAGVCPHV